MNRLFHVLWLGQLFACVAPLEDPDVVKDIDHDGDGVVWKDDCDDSDPNIFDGADEICDGVDNNCDGVIDEPEAINALVWYEDSDGDGFGNGDVSLTQCSQPANYVMPEVDEDDNLILDCDDTSDGAAINPDAEEVCDGVDNDCDGTADDGLTFLDYYPDDDGDGYGDDGADAENSCEEAVDGKVTNNTDCDDANSDVHPGLTWYLDCDNDGFGAERWNIEDLTYEGQDACEVYGLKEENCTTRPLEDPYYLPATDVDEDGDDDFDCDDTAGSGAAIYPGALEVCDDIDNDCDEDIDDDDTSLDGSTTTDWYFDGDGDDYGDEGGTVQSLCEAPSNYVGNNQDCDDTRDDVKPDGTEVCDHLDADEDCDGDADDDDTEGANGKLSYVVDSDGDTFGDMYVAGSMYCDPPEGFVTDKTDCDDDNIAVNRDASEVCDHIDNDCDELIDDDDVDLDITTASSWYIDDDGDGFGNPDVSKESCEAGEDYVADNTDCDDDNGTDTNDNGVSDGFAINSDATEVCDGFDNDCNELFDDTDDGLDGETTSAWFRDVDGDAFGDPDVSERTCVAPLGYVADATDCDDDPTTGGDINPDATEVCDGVDNNCSLTDGPDGDGVDEAGDDVSYADYYTDSDGDGYGADEGTPENSCAAAGKATNNEDCDDTTDSISPAVAENCDDGIDNDCDEATEDVATTWYYDGDGDGYGSSSSVSNCAQPDDYVDNSEDCDDAASTVYPGAAELCDGVISNCDLSSLPDDELDNDGDGYVICEIEPSAWQGSGLVVGGEDCDDDNGTDTNENGVSDGSVIYPGATELCDNGFDDNCDEAVDTADSGCSSGTDADDDGFDAEAAGGDDCDDTDPTIHPLMVEICADGIDNDCDEQTDTEDDEGCDLFIEGADDDEEFGAAIAVGDVNDDGIEDLIIGAPGSDRVYLLLGRHWDGLWQWGVDEDVDEDEYGEAPTSVNILDAFDDGKKLVTIQGPENSLFGASVALLDDPTDSEKRALLIGAPEQSDDDGAMYHLLVSEVLAVLDDGDDTNNTIDLTSDDPVGAVLSGNEGKDGLVGHVVLDGGLIYPSESEEGKHGVLVAAPAMFNTTSVRTGVVYLFGESVYSDTESDPLFITPSTVKQIFHGAEAGDGFGEAVTLGHFNDDDDCMDIAIGAPGAMGGDGQIYVYLNSCGDLGLDGEPVHGFGTPYGSANILTSEADCILQGFDTLEEGAGMSLATAPGMFGDRDGLIVGAPHYAGGDAATCVEDCPLEGLVYLVDPDNCATTSLPYLNQHAYMFRGGNATMVEGDNPYPLGFSLTSWWADADADGEGEWTLGLGSFTLDSQAQGFFLLGEDEIATLVVGEVLLGEEFPGVHPAPVFDNADWHPGLFDEDVDYGSCMTVGDPNKDLNLDMIVGVPGFGGGRGGVHLRTMGD